MNQEHFDDTLQWVAQDGHQWHSPTARQRAEVDIKLTDHEPDPPSGLLEIARSCGSGPDHLTYWGDDDHLEVEVKRFDVPARNWIAGLLDNLGFEASDPLRPTSMPGQGAPRVAPTEMIRDDVVVTWTHLPGGAFGAVIRAH